MKRLVTAAVLAAALGLAPAGAARELRLAGSDLLGSAFARALEEYGRQGGETIAVQFEGSRPAIARLKAGAADVALLALPPGELPPGDPFVSRIIAYQPVVVLVPDRVPLRHVTVPQLRAAFGAGGGENITQWGELGVGGEARLRSLSLHALAPPAGLTLPLFRRFLLKDAEVKPTVKLAASMEDLRAAALRADFALALGPAVPRAGEPLRALAIAANASSPAYAPTSENLHQGSYPLRLPLYVIARRDAVPEWLSFLRFLLSDECGEALAEAHFLPLPVSARNQLVFELEELR